MCEQAVQGCYILARCPKLITQPTDNLAQCTETSLTERKTLPTKLSR